MAKFPTYEEMGKKIAEEALDGYIYKGKTLREWIDILAQTEPWVDWHDIPSDEMTIEQARQAVKDLRKKLAEYLEQEPCEDYISRAESKKRLQEHHDFFVNAYGGFRNLPPDDKSRVDEINNCIAEITNMPSVQPKTKQEPKTGHWIEVIDEIDSLGNKTWHHKCSICGNEDSGWGNYKYCPNCGSYNGGEG